MKRFKKSKAQIAYEAYPFNQNAPAFRDISEYRKQCWEDVADAVSGSRFRLLKRFFKRTIKFLNSYLKPVK